MTRHTPHPDNPFRVEDRVVVTDLRGDLFEGTVANSPRLPDRVMVLRDGCHVPSQWSIARVRKAEPMKEGGTFQRSCIGVCELCGEPEEVHGPTGKCRRSLPVYYKAFMDKLDAYVEARFAYLQASTLANKELTAADWDKADVAREQLGYALRDVIR